MSAAHSTTNKLLKVADLEVPKLRGMISMQAIFLLCIVVVMIKAHVYYSRVLAIT